MKALLSVDPGIAVLLYNLSLS